MGEAEIHNNCQFLFQARAPASPPPSPPASRPRPTSRRTRGPADRGRGLRAAPGPLPRAGGGGASQAPRLVGRACYFFQRQPPGGCWIWRGVLFEILYWEPHTLNLFFFLIANLPSSLGSWQAGPRRPPFSPARHPRFLPSRPSPRAGLAGAAPSQAPVWFLPAAA